ncbi:DUF2399 domain-containing protein [Ammoniphilus sp. CFH 90114]|uniref:DUF2399 domain-containing protein n=1 Tax=Ammoniphilus sp. CFH 90114 TaxID=2493665 RepID=UPI00100E3F68|nr:DUF2399 domain-containing protein [Ammoniphilus sp. CFH 90114]RXT00078.1 DUF2399 domain-containing protein [Ammoniphilus sp. CFH 90114]
MEDSKDREKLLQEGIHYLKQRKKGLERLLQALVEKWIVENPAVFSSLLGLWEEEDPNYPLPMICSYGQFKLAMLSLCDRLILSGCELWYSGDMDPSGFQMAIRLWQRYGNEQVKLWRYQPDLYMDRSSEQVLKTDQWNRLEKYMSEESLSLPHDFYPVCRSHGNKKDRVIRKRLWICFIRI